MFKSDIDEFKSSKISKYLFAAELYIEAFTKRSKLLSSGRQEKPLQALLKRSS
jgi:hypothetical protein